VPRKRKLSRPTYAWDLIRLSMHVRSGTLDDDDRERLANILLQLGYGKTLNEVMGVRRGRPVDPSKDEWVYEIAIASLPLAKGGRGITIEQAIAEEADKRGKAFDTVEKAWKSKRGRAMRRAVKATAPEG
jgi:hypothetical protein